MMDNASLLGKILREYKFACPVVLEIQQYIISVKRTVLINVYKTAGTYNIFLGLPLRIFFSARKIGFSISLVQSSIAATISLLVIAGLMSAGIYYTAVTIQRINKHQEIKTELDVVNNSGARTQTNIDKNRKGVVYKYSSISNDSVRVQNIIPINSRIGISDFSSENLDDETSIFVTDRVRKKLITFFGKEKIIKISGQGINNIDYLISGSAGKLGDSIIVTAKIIDIKNSRVLFITSENTLSEENLPEICNIIGKRLANNIK